MGAANAGGGEDMGISGAVLSIKIMGNTEERTERISKLRESISLWESDIKEATGKRDEAFKELTALHDESRRERTAECSEHHYIPTNAKWQSASQVRCCFCGDIQ